MVERIFIDSDVIVASKISAEKNSVESKKFMEFVIKNKSRRLEFYTSVFSFLELASAMIRRTKNKDKTYSLLYQINKTWKKNIKPIPPVPADTHQSFQRLIDDLIESAITYKTKSGDTIQAHTFAALDLKYFVTWNTKDFKILRQKLKVKVLTPPEMIKKIAETENPSYRKDLRDLQLLTSHEALSKDKYYRALRNQIVHRGKLRIRG